MTATVAEILRIRMGARGQLPAPAERRAIREAAGLSQQDLADAIGTTRQAVSHWELGARTPRGSALRDYLEALQTLREFL
jgi:DNA-binding transcriptional regulator YiaG